MIFAGLQPCSLIDYPGVIASTIFTQGCPFRCVYCHNPELIPVCTSDPDQPQKEEHVLEQLYQRRRIIEGVCITGGEPTIHADLPDFIKKVKRLGLLVKLDTNGIHPNMIERLIKDQLVDFFAMDLKHTWEHYSDVIGIDQSSAVNSCKNTFHLIQDSAIPHEFRTTVYSGLHGQEDLKAIASQLRPGERYALQDIRYGTTLNPILTRTPSLDLKKIADEIQTLYPMLHLEVRS